MIEFKLKDRRLRLIDGVFYSRALNNKGEETKKETWRKVSFHETNDGYLRCDLTHNKVKHGLLQHRMVWYAHNQDWNIWDTSRDNLIDHKNKDKKDNRLCNLHVVTHSENKQNQGDLDKWAASGLSQKDFAIPEGLSFNTLATHARPHGGIKSY